MYWAPFVPDLSGEERAPAHDPNQCKQNDNGPHEWGPEYEYDHLPSYPNDGVAGTHMVKKVCDLCGHADITEKSAPDRRAGSQGSLERPEAGPLRDTRTRRADAIAAPASITHP